MRTISEEEAVFTMRVYRDNVPVIGALPSLLGDEKDEIMDIMREQKVYERIKQGELWAWAYVEVTARWKKWKGMASMGFISLKDEADFRRGGEYQKLREMALENLNEEFQCSVDEIRELEF